MRDIERKSLREREMKKPFLKWLDFDATFAPDVQKTNFDRQGNSWKNFRISTKRLDKVHKHNQIQKNYLQRKITTTSITSSIDKLLPLDWMMVLF